MRVRMVFNASSGYGAAGDTAGSFRRALQAQGHRVEARPTGLGHQGAFDGLPEAADLLVLVGGDGTVHHALPHAVASGVPLYHVPTGTENLFARDWGMNRQPATLLRAIHSQAITRADVGTCNGLPFALMVSAGFDAAIVHARCASPRKSDGHRAYLLPLLEQIADPVFPTLRMTVDGEVLVDAARGVAVIANSRQYAMRLDPAHRACCTDGLLDAVFLPCSTPSEAVVIALRTRLRRHLLTGGALHRSGRRIRVESLDGPAPCQVDGEPLGLWPIRAGNPPPGASPVSTLDLAIMPGALRILSAIPAPPALRPIMNGHHP